VIVETMVVVVQAANKKQKYERISEKKMSTPVEVLCKVCSLTFLCKLLVFKMKCHKLT